MDSYKLTKLAGQILEEKSTVDRLHEKFEETDVSACISEDLQVPQSGYNCLHLSVLKDDVKLTQQLLDRGADLLKQGSYNGYSPLHTFIIERPYHEDKKVEELFGRLGMHPIVHLLLSEQVKRNLSLNPKCLTGLTHLHIACMVDHSQAVELFLRAGESVNQAVAASACVFAGNTPLHMAIRYSSIAVAKLLIYYGADINQKDAFGDTPLHKLIQRLILTADYSTMEKPAQSLLLIKELKKLETMVGFMLTTSKKYKVKFVNNLALSAFNAACIDPSLSEETLTEDVDVHTLLTNFIDDLGLSALHVACTLRNPCMVQEILQEDIDVNKPLSKGLHRWSEWTALHLAACCSIETVKLLIQHGADIKIKTTKGFTPLDICTRKYPPAVIHSILSTKEEYREILLSDGSTKLLDLLLAMDNCDQFQNFLQEMSDVNAIVPLDSPIWPGYNVLHLAIVMDKKVKHLHMKSMVMPKNYAEKLNTCSDDEEKNYWKRIVICLSRRCSLIAKNAAGLTPVHLAFHRRKASVVEKLLNSCCSSSANVVDESSGLSFLHMACTIGKRNVVERFVNDINTPVKAGFEWCQEGLTLLVPANSTPLHIALMLDNREIVELLLQQKNIDLYARDSLGFTPIHLSVVSQSMTSRFLNKKVNLKEAVSRDGLSYLHVAALVDDGRAIETLVRNGAKVNVVFRPLDDFGKFVSGFVRDTPLHVAVKHGNLKAVRALIQAGADIHAASSMSKYDTPLQAAMQNVYDDRMLPFVKKLRQDQWIKGSLEPCGVTLLHFACATFDEKWAKMLLEKGADPNAQICMDIDYMGDWKGFAALHVLVARARFIKVKKKNLIDMVLLLLKHGADVTLQDDEGYSPLLLAEKFTNEALGEEIESKTKNELKTRMLSIAELLMKSQRSFAVNPATRREGSTHFHYACKTNKLGILRKFLKNGVDVNQAKRATPTGDGGFTPLHFALSSNSPDVVWLLLSHKADVTARDVFGNTPLHSAISNNVDDVRLLEEMYSLGADVKAKSYEYVTPFDMLLFSDCISYEKFKFFLDHGCSLELDNESNVNIIGLLLSNADPLDREDIFILMVKSCNLIEKIKNGFNAIKSLVGFIPNPNWEAARRWTVDMFLEGIQFFMDMGCEIDAQNYQGTTALHEAFAYGNVEAIEALLLLGASINILDEYGHSALALDDLNIKSDDDQFNRFIKITAMHVWKMNFVGLDIWAANEFAAKCAWEKAFADITIQQRCEDELKRLEKIKVGENWTLKDFLSETKAVIEYQFLSLEKRQPVDEFFKSHADLRKKFPEFCGLLMAQYRKAVKYVKVYWPVKGAIAMLLKLELPEECFKELLTKIAVVGLVANKYVVAEDFFETD